MITEEVIEQVDRLYGDEGPPIMGDRYPFFEQDPGIEINETMENYEEENIVVNEEIPIQHEDRVINMEIEEGDEEIDDVNEEKNI